MGMNYNITFHDAVIKPERFAEMLHRRAMEDMSKAQLAEAAIDHVRECISDWGCDPELMEDGALSLEGLGFNDSASYSYGETLTELLGFCEPGAFIHETDAEEGTGEQWRHVKMPDGTVKTFTPTVTWPAEAGGELNS